MAKDKSDKSDITRVDLRIPNHIFKDIEKLALETNQPLHHISGKVITTTVILNLINLGLESVRTEDFSIESIASKDSLREAEIEKKVLNTLTQRLEGIVSDKLTDIMETKIKEAIGVVRSIGSNEDNSETDLLPKEIKTFEDSKSKKYKTYREARQVIVEMYLPKPSPELPEGFTNKLSDVTKFLKENKYFNKRGNFHWYTNEVTEAYYEEIQFREQSESSTSIEP